MKNYIAKILLSLFPILLFSCSNIETQNSYTEFNNGKISFTYPENLIISETQPTVFSFFEEPNIYVTKHDLESLVWERIYYYSDMSNDEWSYPPNENVWRDVYDIYNELMLEQKNVLLWYKKWYLPPDDLRLE